MLSVAAYQLTLQAMGAAALLLSVPTLVVDFAGMAARHKPDHPVTPDEGSLHFRAWRAQVRQNSGQSVTR